MSDGSPAMELLVCVVMDHHQVEEILLGFLDLGVQGSTVLNSRGMGSILSNEVPIFAGFRALFPSGSAGSYTVLSVMSAELIADAVRLIEEICGDFSRGGTGFLFTVPVGLMRGLAEEIG